MSPRAATILYAAALSAALIIRGWFVLALPFGQTVSGRLEGLNDEPAHFNYVRYLAEHRAFPVQTRHVAEPGAFERADFEYYQPPLYYLLCAPLVAAAGERTGLILCRALSLVCAVLTLVVLSRVLAMLGLGVAARRAGVAFAALLPVHAYFASLVSNDSLCWLIAALIAREMLARVRTGPAAAPGWREPAADVRLGILLGLGMLTKGALAIFYPVALLAYAMGRGAGGGRGVVVRALMAVGVSLLIAAPWYVRNAMVYGSPFALEVGFGPPEPGRLALIAQTEAAKGTIQSFWFPMQHLKATPAVIVLRLGTFLVALHATAATIHLVRRFPLDARTIIALALLAVTIVSHVALNLRWGESEGRFLLPALGPIAFLIVAPVFAFLARRRWGEWAAWGYVVLLAIHPYFLLAA